MKRSSASRSNTNVIVSLPQKFVASASAPSSTTNIPSTSCSSSLFDALWPCAFYLSCSLTMNILTKALITSYGWHFIYSLGAIQNIFTFTVLSCYKLNLKWKQTETNDSSMKKNKEPSLLTQTKVKANVNDISFVFRIMVPLVCLNIGNMILGFASLQLVNMPMYLVLRRLTTIKVLLIEWIILGKDLSIGIKLSLCASAFGSLLACSTDATADFNGYFLVLLQNLCSATSLTFSKESQLTCVQLVYFNSFAASIICSILAISFETKLIAQQFLYLKDPFFLGLFFCMCCVCVFYQFSIFICTIQNSPLATSVTGNIKDLMSTFFGFILFQDTKYNQWNLLGIGFSFFGAYSFSYLKYQMTISSSSSSSSVSSSSFSSFSFSLKKEKKEISSSDKATAS